MFFPERVKSIKKMDKVLEVGPGNTPFYRSDVLLEKIFDNECEAFKQSGCTKSKNLKKEIVYYKDAIFPFSNKEFDYVICSHVLEHIPKKDIAFFISELCRTSIIGYIEIPLYNFELITAIEVHLNLIYVDKDHTIHFLSKEDIDLTNTSYVKLRELFIRLDFNGKILPLNLNIFGDGFEFKEKINFIIHENVESFFQLVENEFLSPKLRWHKDFSYYLEKIIRQFNKNNFKQKLYHNLGIVFK